MGGGQGHGQLEQDSEGPVALGMRSGATPQPAGQLPWTSAQPSTLSQAFQVTLVQAKLGNH